MNRRMFLKGSVCTALVAILSGKVSSPVAAEQPEMTRDIGEVSFVVSFDDIDCGLLSGSGRIEWIYRDSVANLFLLSLRCLASQVKFEGFYNDESPFFTLYGPMVKMVGDSISLHAKSWDVFVIDDSKMHGVDQVRLLVRFGDKDIAAAEGARIGKELLEKMERTKL